MLRVRNAALSVLMLSGCLDPLTSDQAGYSRNLLPANAEIASVSTDPSFTRRIDLNDGVTGTAPLKSGFAVGMPLKYWDLGVGKASATPAYQFAHCDEQSMPLPGGVLDHPMLFDTVPGDADYSQLWAVSYVCVTPKYAGQRIPTMLALSDAYELGIAVEPTQPMKWVHAPVVSEGVTLDGATDLVGTARPEAYCRGLVFTVVDFGEQGSIDASIVTMGKMVTTGNVYEIVRQGSTKIERVVFGSAGFNEDGTRGIKYAPIWTVVAVTITADADINMFGQESDIATINMDRSFTKQNDKIVSIVASTTRSSREIQF